MVQRCDLAITGRCPRDGINLTRCRVLELRAQDVTHRHHALERRVNHFHRSCGEHVEIEVVPLDAAFQHRVQQLNILFEPDAFADFDEMFATHARTEFWVVQKKVGELRTLLDQVELGHPGGLAFKLSCGNAHQLAQNIARIVES